MSCALGPFVTHFIGSALRRIDEWLFGQNTFVTHQFYSNDSNTFVLKRRMEICKLLVVTFVTAFFLFIFRNFVLKSETHKNIANPLKRWGRTHTKPFSMEFELKYSYYSNLNDFLFLFM